MTAENHQGMDTPDFASSWRDLRDRLDAYLIGRGVAAETAEDVVQETGLRLIGSWGRIDHSRPLAPLARKIAWNLVIDRHRHNAAARVVELTDVPSSYDIEAHGLARARLHSAATALTRLRPHDRVVLLGEVGVLERSTDRMARMRARRRLRAAVDAMRAGFAFVPSLWRRISGSAQAGAGGELAVGATAGFLAIASIAALSLDGAGHALANPRPNLAHKISSAELVATRIADRRLRPSDKAAPRATADDGAAERAASTSRDEAASTKRTDIETEAGPARAEKGAGQGYVYVQVCLGEDTDTTADDVGVTVVMMDGGQNGEEEPPECRYGKEEDERE